MIVAPVTIESLIRATSSDRIKDYLSLLVIRQPKIKKGTERIYARKVYVRMSAIFRSITIPTAEKSSRFI